MKINKKLKQRIQGYYSFNKAARKATKKYSRLVELSQSYLMEQFAKLGNDRPS
jgi:hypothetical protein